MILLEGLEARTHLSAWYVAPTGSDANPGTRAKPFQPIQQAANVSQPGDTVFLRRGVYRESVVPARSGTTAAPITFRPYKRESVTIDGADPLAAWSAQPDGIYQSTVGWGLGTGGTQLFDAGRMVNEAQWPNTPGSGTTDLVAPATATVAAATAQPAVNGLASATISVPDRQDAPGVWTGSGRSYIRVQGIHLFASTINTDSASSNLLIDGIDARYVSPDLMRADAWAMKLRPHTTGIILNGTSNVIQNSTIAYNSGDDGPTDYVIHHNVVWNCDSALRINAPGSANLVYNNTLISDHTALESTADAQMTGSAFVNNLFARTVMIGQGASDASNLMDVPDSMFVNAAAHDYRLRRRSPAIDAGQVIPPFTDGYRGAAPDMGAYEFRARPFAAGAGTTSAKRR